MRLGTLILFLSGLLNHFIFGQTIYHVDASNEFSDFRNGKSWAGAYRYLQDALERANPGMRSGWPKEPTNQRMASTQTMDFRTVSVPLFSRRMWPCMEGLSGPSQAQKPGREMPTRPS